MGVNRFLQKLGLSPDDTQIPIGYSILDKELGVWQYIAYMLNRTNEMFIYSGLPETIPPSILELYLQLYGFVAVTEVKGKVLNNGMDIDISDSSVPKDGKRDLVNASDPAAEEPVEPENVEGGPPLYVFRCSLGGKPDIYYRPTHCIIANPALPNGSLERDVGKDVVIIRNDNRSCGLLPIFQRYAVQMVENDISIRSAQINGRSQMTIVANDGTEYQSANAFMEGLVNGSLSAIASRPFLEGVSVTPTPGQSSIITQLLELGQYLKASWYNELGLNSNFNMKREYVSAEEIGANTDILMPLVDNMLKSRQMGLDLVNKMYGTNITVRKNSAWANKEEETLARMMEGDDEGVSQSDEKSADS